MIYKFVLLTGLVLTSTVFANETSSVHNRLIIAAIHDQKGFFNVRELHDMGDSGVQQIDYIVNCTNHTLALTDFAVVTEKGRLVSNEPAIKSMSLSFYRPLIEHDQKIAQSVCHKLVTMNSHQ